MYLPTAHSILYNLEIAVPAMYKVSLSTGQAYP
jgi:hypothetical protein